MASFTQLTYHVVFATKFRRPLITEDIRERLYEYLGGIIRAKNGHLVQVGGVAEQVHLLAQLSPAIALSDLIRDLKANASGWVNGLPDRPPHRFKWQKGYGAFTVSYSRIESVRKYIANQVEHHRTKSFEEEYTEFLTQHGIEFRREFLFEDEHHG